MCAGKADGWAPCLTKLRIGERNARTTTSASRRRPRSRSCSDWPVTETSFSGLERRVGSAGVCVRSVRMAAGYHKRRGVGLVARRRLRVARRAAAVVLLASDSRRSPAGHNSRQGETGKSFRHPLLPDVIESMRTWPEHRRGGFSVDRSVHLPAGDRAGTERMVRRPAACGGVPACGSRPKPPRRNRRPGRPRRWARVSRPRPPTDRRSSRNRRPAAAPARPGPPAVDEIPRFDQVGHRPRVGNGAGVCRGPASGQATPLPAWFDPRCLRCRSGHAHASAVQPSRRPLGLGVLRDHRIRDEPARPATEVRN